MAITYNDLYDHYRIFRVSSGGTIWSSNLSGLTAFDYFDDNCQVGDFILFAGETYKPWKDIQVNIGTAFSAASVTFVWEYWNGVSWKTLNVVDGTANWTAIGTQTIKFTPPIDWNNDYTGNDSVVRRYYLVRCRISAVDAPTEGGANTTSRVKAGNNTITVNDTGVNRTFNDIYNADVAGSWGVVERVKTNDFTMFKLSCHLTLSYCNFTSINEAVIFERNYNYRNTYASVTIGEKVSDYTGKNGSSWYFYLSPKYSTLANQFSQQGGNLKIYGSTITILGIGSYWQTYQQYGTYSIECVDSTFQCPSSWEINTYFSPDDVNNHTEFRNCRFICAQVTFNQGAPKVMDRCQVSATNTPLRTNYGFSPTVKEVWAYGSPTYRGLYLYGFTGIFTVRDSPNIDLSDNYWQYTSTPQTGIVRDEYSLRIKVQDVGGNPISGASVAVVDKNGEAITGSPFASDENGEINCGYLLRRTAKSSNETANTRVSIMTDYTPHTITISKPGYQTKTLKLTMDRKREEVEVLEKEVPIFIGKGKVLVNVDPKNNQNNILI